MKNIKNTLCGGLMVTALVLSACAIDPKEKELGEKSEIARINALAIKTCGGKEHVKRVHTEGFVCKKNN